MSSITLRLQIMTISKMAVTRLKRKAKRNRVIAKGKVARIQRLNAKPLIKKVDREQLLEEFKKRKDQ